MLGISNFFYCVADVAKCHKIYRFYEFFHYGSHRVKMNLICEKTFVAVAGFDLCTTSLATRKYWSSRPLGHPTRWRCELIFFIIIHADRHDCQRSLQILDYTTFEFCKVMTSNSTFYHISEVV